MNPKDQAWRNWPLVRIEKEYSPSSCVPSEKPFLADYAIRSRNAGQSLACQRDLQWGDSPDETLDFFPSASRNAPLLVFIHGGYWQELSKNESLLPPSITRSRRKLMSKRSSINAAGPSPGSTSRLALWASIATECLLPAV